MRKVKVTTQPGSNGKKLWLFPTVEAIYMWACATDRGEQLLVPGIEELVLEPDGFIEAELRGFEYSYDRGATRRYDLVRLGKADRVKNDSGVLVTLHSGWVCGAMLPMKAYSDSEIAVVEMGPGDDKIDLSALFKDGAEAEG